MKKVFWVNNTPLSGIAKTELKNMLGNIELIQLSELNSEYQKLSTILDSDIFAFQRGTLPPALEDEIKMENKVLEHEIDSHFNFTMWSWFHD